MARKDFPEKGISERSEGGEGESHMCNLEEEHYRQREWQMQRP